MKFAFRAFCLSIFCAASLNLYAANPCATGGAPEPREGTGLGGTGHGPLQQDGSGSGGTGYAPLISGSTDGTGMGGTGYGPVQQDGSGAGGTGHTPWMEATDGNGVGGTGHETEVEGVITGFASICVNGLELHYQSSTPIAINGRRAATKDLAVGQVVRIQARGLGDQLAISSLQVRHLMVATLQDINNGHALAMGRKVLIDPNAPLPSNLSSGNKIAFSGFAVSDGTIVATRLDAVPTDSPDSISGEVSKDNQGRLTIDGMAVDAPNADLKPGEIVRAEGRFDEGRFKADRVVRDEPPSRSERFVIQGLVKQSGRNRLSIGDKKLAVDPAAHPHHELPKAGTWVRVEGQRLGKELLIQKFEVQEKILPDRRDAGKKSANQHSHQNRHASDEEGDEKQERSKREDATEQREKSDEREDFTREGKTEKSEPPERREKTEGPERPEKHDTPERPERPEKRDTPERPERPEKPERTERTERPERPERPESHDRD